MTVREWIKDVCLCGGKPERVKKGALILLACSDCGKASRERKPGAYSNSQGRKEI